MRLCDCATVPRMAALTAPSAATAGRADSPVRGLMYRFGCDVYPRNNTSGAAYEGSFCSQGL
eukprot:8964388-Pyramimonas_sp.AAC.1